MKRGRRLWHQVRHSRHSRHAGLLYQLGSDLELLHRAMAFAALGLVTIVPLLVVVAAADPVRHRGFALWIVDGMGLSGEAAAAVQQLFTPPGQVISTTGALSLIALALFGISFAACVQTGYEKIWGLTSALWHRLWRQTAWFVLLVLYLYGEVQTREVVRGPPRTLLTVVLGALFFWCGQRLLLGARVAWHALWPGALATMLGLVGLRAVSVFAFAPLIVTNAVAYGPVGTVLMVETWLVAVGYVIFGGAALGAHLVNRDPRHRPPPSRRADVGHRL